MNNTTNTNKATTNNTFADLLREYEKQATTRTPKTEKAYTEALTNLATATVYSVLKKCIDASENKALTQLKWDIARDTAYLNKLRYAVENSYITAYDSNGERVKVVTNKDLYKAIAELCSESLGDGFDLVHDAIIGIMQETEKAREKNYGMLPENFMEEKYTIRRLKRKVWIKVEESANGWETVETSAIQEVFKAVRRSIENSRTIQSQSRYIYLKEFIIDFENGTYDYIYRRLPKYTDIGGTVCDFNGKEIAYTTDEQSVQDIDILIEQLNLTKRESTILQLRFSGYGYKAIATYMGISVDNAKRCGQRLREKATAIGLTPCAK